MKKNICASVGGSESRERALVEAGVRDFIRWPAIRRRQGEDEWEALARLERMLRLPSGVVEHVRMGLPRTEEKVSVSFGGFPTVYIKQIAVAKLGVCTPQVSSLMGLAQVE